ncbi:phosphate-phosphonate ABC transporter periplasmic protein [Marine Group I thaumarchaeote SCGC AAA799-E16]|uniref:Phosphate-phosphonate ABC transporter periplasmic protein n=2 Tax=Marine Group I TaxID=905826 RepID=A0A087RZQ4_9ARCH|nr:phosphate-phosphonate ABC transporter periplasmic protein [Marine Group I thaumarchaeote SCGC AAA799-E16]KFM18958.1 phosphate-phosphonate ABC transporter periplasmic protein [Marine Group I thaumarchaeote SCGC RSA3]
MKNVTIAGITIIVIAVIFSLVFFAIESESKSEIPSESSKTISIGTIHRDAAKMTKRYQPMIDHIATELSDGKTTFEGRVMSPDSQEEMIMYINDQKIDIYFDSPLIGMKILQETKMTPVLLGWKEGVSKYHSVFIVPIDSEITSLNELTGKSIIFEDSESTSGYFLPRYHLETMGYSIGNELSDDISFEFSLDDENTPIWLLEGRGDVGVLSNIDFEEIPINAKNQLKIIGQTEDVPRQIIFFRESLENETEILEIFLEMNTDTMPEILDSAKVTGFTEINLEDLSQVKSMLDSLNFE